MEQEKIIILKYNKLHNIIRNIISIIALFTIITLFIIYLNTGNAIYYQSSLIIFLLIIVSYFIYKRINFLFKYEINFFKDYIEIKDLEFKKIKNYIIEFKEISYLTRYNNVIVIKLNEFNKSINSNEYDIAALSLYLNSKDNNLLIEKMKEYDPEIKIL